MIKELVKLYWWSLILILGILLFTLIIGWWGNITGNVWIPALLFCITLFLRFFVADVATFFIKQTAGLIAIPLPVITYNDAVRQVQEKIEPRLATIFTFVALAFMLLAAIHIDSDFKTQIDVTSLIMFGVIVLGWRAIITKAKDNITPKLILFVGILMIIRAVLVYFAPSIYELTNHKYYPGIKVDRSQIVSTTRELAERNAQVLAESDIKTLQNFRDLVNRFPTKSTDQVIAFVKENYASNSPERAIIEAEERRRASIPAKKIADAGGKLITHAATALIGDEVVKDGDFFPELGGNSLTSLMPKGYEYTIKVEGCREQYNIDASGVPGTITSCANGSIGSANGKKYYWTDAATASNVYDSSKPLYSILLRRGNALYYYADNAEYKIRIEKDENIFLVLNAQKYDEFFQNSKGTFRIKITRKPL